MLKEVCYLSTIFLVINIVCTLPYGSSRGGGSQIIYPLENNNQHSHNRDFQQVLIEPNHGSFGNQYQKNHGISPGFTENRPIGDKTTIIAQPGRNQPFGVSGQTTIVRPINTGSGYQHELSSNTIVRPSHGLTGNERTTIIQQPGFGGNSMTTIIDQQPNFNNLGRGVNSGTIIKEQTGGYGQSNIFKQRPGY